MEKNDEKDELVNFKFQEISKISNLTVRMSYLCYGVMLEPG